MDWWESKHVEVEIPATTDDGEAQKAAFDVTCTPCQHFTGRGVFDRFKTLWASWVVQEAAAGSSDVQKPATDFTGVKVYFAGDTGYRSVPDGMNEDEVPTCPAFLEIGERFGGFDFAMIPIGCVSPICMMLRISSSLDPLAHIYLGASCLPSTARRRIVFASSKIYVRNEPLGCIGGERCSSRLSIAI